MKYRCPNFEYRCSIQGSKDEIIDHLKKGCPFTREPENRYHKESPDFFNTLLSAYIVHEIFTDHDETLETDNRETTFEGGDGESGGGGSSGSWESDSSDNSDDSSTDSSSSEDD